MHLKSAMGKNNFFNNIFNNTKKGASEDAPQLTF